MYASSTTFGRKMVSQCTLTFAEFLKNKIETTIKGRATNRNFVQAIPLMLDLIQLVDPERISIITLKSILDSVHRCEHSIPKAPEVVRLISTRIEDEARATYYINNAPEGVEVDKEDFIRRWNGAYDVLTVQTNSPDAVQK